MDMIDHTSSLGLMDYLILWSVHGNTALLPCTLPSVFTCFRGGMRWLRLEGVSCVVAQKNTIGLCGNWCSSVGADTPVKLWKRPIPTGLLCPSLKKNCCVFKSIRSVCHTQKVVRVYHRQYHSQHTNISHERFSIWWSPIIMHNTSTESQRFCINWPLTSGTWAHPEERMWY